MDDARQARELDAQREQCAREQLLADVQLQRDREAQREIDLRRDLYDLGRERSRAAALEAELKCLKATTGPPTVAYEVIEVPVQPDDIAPLTADAVVQPPPSRPVTPIDNLVVQGLPANLIQRQPPVPAAMVHRPDIAYALTRHSHPADTCTVYSGHSTSISALQPSFMLSQAPTMYQPGPERIQPQPSAASDSVFTQYQPDTLPCQLVTRAAMPDPVRTHMQAHTFSRSMNEPACTHSTVTSTLPRQPACMPTRSPTLVGPPPSDDAVTSALLDRHSVLTDLAYSDYTVQRSSDNVSFLDRTNTVMSQRTDQLLAGFATRTSTASEQLLADLPPPPHVCRQPIVPLLSDRTQTTASEYVNTDSVPSLSAHMYADTPFDSTVPCLPIIQPTVHNYQNISANLSLPSLSTHTNVPTHVNAPLSQAIALGQSNVTQPNALYAASYASDLNSSGLIALNPNIARSLYADNSQRLPIVVE